MKENKTKAEGSGVMENRGGWGKGDCVGRGYMDERIDEKKRKKKEAFVQ